MHYDYIWFVDSDATPNPIFMNISVGTCVALSACVGRLMGDDLGMLEIGQIISVQFACIPDLSQTVLQLLLRLLLQATPWPTGRTTRTR